MQQELFSYEELPIITLNEWSNFIEEHQANPRIIGFFNLDVIGDPKQTRENFKILKSRLPHAKIYPIWQFTDSLEELDKLVNSEEMYDVIGIGGMVPFLSTRKHMVREKLDIIFERFPHVNFHFLGGANEMLIEYPFFSSDSTAFLNARKSEKQRKVYLDNGYRIDAPKEMSTLEIIKQNLAFLFSLERSYEAKQLSIFAGAFV